MAEICDFIFRDIANLVKSKQDFSWPTEKAESLLKTLKEEDSFTAPELLFQKITPERKEELKIKYKEGV